MTDVLVVDVGGSHVKVAMAGKEPIKIPSGPAMTAGGMAAAVLKAIDGWKYDVVSIGFPGAVRNGTPLHEPHNLSGGWVRFDYAKAFGKPVRIVNDAAMQALGAYHGGRMLFLGLGTGLGSALIVEGVLVPLELAHLPYRRGGTYEDYVGLRGLLRMGRKRWTRHVEKVVALLAAAMEADYVVLGGGQTRKLKRVPAQVQLGTNEHAVLGGVKLWNPVLSDGGARIVERGLQPPRPEGRAG